MLGTAAGETITSSNVNSMIYGFDGADFITGGNGNDAIYADSSVASVAETFTIQLQAGGVAASSLTFDAVTFSGEIVALATPSVVDTVGSAVVTAFNGSTKWVVTYNPSNDTLTFAQKAGTEAAIADVSAFNFTDPSGVISLIATTQQGVTGSNGGFNDTIVASAGRDTVDGGTGSDTYKMTASVFGNLNLNENNPQDQGGDNTVTLNSIEAIDASGQIDSAIGLTLTGLSSAASTITGGSGNDIITGGAGADTFVFAATAVLNGTDVITDFTTGADILNVDAMTAATAATTVTGPGPQTATAGVFYYLGGQTAGAADSIAGSVTALAAAGTWTDAAATVYILVSDDNSAALYEYTGDAVNNGFNAAEFTLMATITGVVAAGDLFFGLAPV